MNVTRRELPKPAALNELPKARHYPIDDLKDERTQTLRRLLNEGHASCATLREPNLQFHTHLPHFLGSAYRLGASSKQLQESYDHETPELKAVSDSFIRGNKLSQENWTAFRNNKDYCVAYVDFFDGEVKRHDGDWKRVLQRYLYDGDEPTINGMIGGLGHPFIHLAYAYEFESSAVATEALSLGCTELHAFHKDLVYPPKDNSTYKTHLFADVLAHIQADNRVDNLFDTPGFVNTYILMEKHRDLMLEHWNAWIVEDPLQQLEQICDLSILLAIGSGDAEKQFDFFLIHLATVAHALRILWHEFPPRLRTSILKQYSIFVLYIYIAQLRRPFRMNDIADYDLKGRDWEWVVQTALAHQAAMDVHFFKVVCAPQAFEQTYGSKDGFYLKAAVKFVTEFNGWTGFGAGTDGVDPSNM